MKHCLAHYPRGKYLSLQVWIVCLTCYMIDVVCKYFLQRYTHKAREKILKQVEDESARRMEHSSPGSRIDQHDSFLYQDKE